jgi:iron complex outermembrane receptor protein
MNENYFQINENQKINVRFWYQNTRRNIPPSMSQEMNVSNQKDESYRITSEWQRNSENLLLAVRAAHFYETLMYDDSITNIHSTNKSKVTIAEAELKFSVTRLDLITITFNNTYTDAFSNGYKKNPHQNRSALIGNYKIHSRNNVFNGFLTIRQEIIQPNNGELDTIIFTPFKSTPVCTNASHPFTYAIGGESHPFKWLSLNFSVAQHYRIPTFNDLYWAQGGNIHLRPESGWGEEAGITVKKQFNKLSATANATVFNRNIDNWILWTPTAFGYWSPDNIMKVWSRGAEYKLTFKYGVQNVTFALNVLWNYTVSTSEKAKTINDASVGKQLIYTPMYKGNGSFTVGYKNFNITYNQKYVGYTYTSADNKSYLKPYLVGNVRLASLFTISEFKLQVFTQVNNVLDRRFQVIENRPMPGRNYQLGCVFYFTKPNNKTSNNKTNEKSST